MRTLQWPFTKKGEVIVYTLATFVLLLMLGVVFETWQAQRNIDRNIGNLSPAQTWIERHLNSYSQDVYDMTQSLLRTKSNVLLYAYGHIEVEKFLEQVATVEAKYVQFLPGTPLDAEMSAYDSFAPSMQEVEKFIQLCKGLAADKSRLNAVLVQSDIAIDEWSLLNSDAVVREYGLRDILEDGIVRLRAALEGTIYTALALLILTFLTLVCSVVAVIKYLQAVKSRSETIERLVASVGHDLRSPLQSINSAAALFSLTGSEERRQTALGVIRSSIKTLSRLVDDIVQIVRQEKLDYRASAVDIESWFVEFCETYRSKATTKGLMWESTTDLSWSTVEIDPDRLSQCFGNLVDNAIKYSDAGMIKVELEVHQKQGQPGKMAELLFSVTDEGVGIRSDDLKRVFLPFERSAVDSHRNGMGLGLSIVSTILESQGGNVTVVSKLGVGSTFRTRLPVKLIPSSDDSAPVAATQVAELVTHHHHRVERQCVLVVDDDGNISGSLSAVLEEFGFDVLTAANGREAMKVLNTTPIRVVVSDIQMPVMDGFELARQCKYLVPEPYFIAQTAYTKELAQHEGATDIFDACLTKPVDELELVAHIRRGFDK